MRFSLKLIFIVVTIVALACGAMFSFPPRLSLLTLMALTAMMHAGCIAWIIWGRCYQRAFAIGFTTSIFAAMTLNIYGAFLIADISDDFLSAQEPWFDTVRILFAE